jgi:hypothetical protein
VAIQEPVRALADAVEPIVEVHSGVERFLAEIGPGRYLNFFLFVGKRDRGHQSVDVIGNDGIGEAQPSVG